MATTPTLSPLDAWNAVAARFPQDMPDTAYDAQREQFVNSTITPWAMQQGFSPSVAREQFLKNSERPGKAMFPRAEVAAKAAVAEAVSPILGLAGAREPQARLERWVEQAKQEAVRQGAGTTIPEMIGRGVGMTPYLLGGEAVAAGAGLTGVAAGIAGMSLGQAAMDGAKAEDGQRLIKGFEGAAAGAAFGAVTEGGLSLLRSTPAQAMEKTLKQVATPAEEEVAKASTIIVPDLADKVVKQAASDAKTAESIGVPATPPQVQGRGIAIATFKTTDGKSYQIPADQLADRLAAGDSLDQIAGSATEIQAALKTAEKQAAKAKKLNQTKSAPIAPGKPAGTDTFEPTAVPIRPEGVASTTPSPAPSSFTGWSTDYMERYLQQNMLDFSMSQAQRDAAATRLRSLASESFNKVQDYLAAGGGKVETSPIPAETLEPEPAPTPTADSPTFLPIYQAISNKGEININSLVSKVGINLDEANTLIEQAKAAGLLQESGQIVKGGGAEVIQKYRVVPKKVSEVPAFDRGAKSAIENTPYDPIDSLLDKLRKSLVEQYPELRADLFPPPGASAEPVSPLDEAPSDLEQQLRDSLELQKFPTGLAARSSKGEPRKVELTPIPQPPPYSRNPTAAGWYENGRYYGGVGMTHEEAFELLPNNSSETGAVRVLLTNFGSHPGFLGETKSKGLYLELDPVSIPSALKILNDYKGYDLTHIVIDIHAPKGATNSIEASSIAEAKARLAGLRGGLAASPGIAPTPPGLPPMNPAPRDIAVFQRAGKDIFVKTLTELDPSIAPEEAARYFDWNVTQRNAAPKVRPDYTNLPLRGESGSLAQTAQLSEARTGIYMPEQGVSRGVLFHEGLHSNFYNTGLHDILPEVMDDETAKQLFEGGFHPEVRDWYRENTPQYVPEETYVHAAQAYRSGDRQMLQNFADADTDRETLDAWFAGKTRELIGLNSIIPDSVSKRILDRRLNDLVNRSGGSLEQMSMQPAALGAEVDFNDGRWEVRDADQTVHKFDTREELADYLYDNHAPPVNVPELLDLSGLPEGIRGPAARPHGPRAPIGTTPPPPELRPGRDIKAGSSVFSFYFRPFYSWVDDVADKFKWPALSEVMHRVQDGEIGMNNALRPYHQVLQDSIGKIPQDRQSMLFKVIEAAPENKQAVADTLGLTTAERDALTAFNEKFVAPLESELGVNLEQFIGKYQGANKMGLDEVSSSSLSNRAASGPMKFLGDGWRTGELDPRDQNLLNVASEYIRLGMRKKFMEDPLVDAAKLVNAEDTGTYIAGNLQPLLARHINYLRGVPDYSARVIHEATGTVMNLINEGIDRANKVLPESWKLGSLDVTPREALNKWIAFSYAGGLMYRPMVLVRNAMQYFLTTFPMLGAKYTMRGLEKFSGALSKESGDEIWQTAQKYGALLGDRELMRYQTGAESESIGGAVSQAVDKNVQRWMGMMQWSHNVNRLAAFWGHAERVKDALAELGTDAEREAFAKQAGLNYLTKVQKGKYLDELPYLNTPERSADFAYRAAKDLVDVSQWNYSRGAAPGGYKYALGKLFGQYGTWPLNYIEWARRVVGSGDAAEKVGTLTRLALAHTAVLKAGEAMGVDTAGWTFTQPGAYGGGPLFNSVINVPGSFDFETEKGAEARRAVVRPVWPMAVPGGLAAETIFKAIHSDDPNVWKIVLGFHPMKPAEYGRGLHLLPPETEPR